MDDRDESYAARENLWDQQWPLTDEGNEVHAVEEIDNLDEETPFPDVVGTTDVMEAVRDAEPYSPPTDPPVLPGGREGIHMATGFGSSPEEEIVRSAPAPGGDEDILVNVLELLEDDSITSKLHLRVDVQDGVVTLSGNVPSDEDADRAADLVTQFVTGVIEVVDRTTVNPNVE